VPPYLDWQWVLEHRLLRQALQAHQAHQALAL
jgi:hypothetical protein